MRPEIPSFVPSQEAPSARMVSEEAVMIERAARFARDPKLGKHLHQASTLSTRFALEHNDSASA